MKSEYQVWMDFRKAEAQAQRLRAVAMNMNNLADWRMRGALDSVRSNWEGENSEAFLAKGEILKGKIEGTGDDLRKIADTVEKIAQRTRDAELNAIRIARERESKR